MLFLSIVYKSPQYAEGNSVLHPQLGGLSRGFDLTGYGTCMFPDPCIHPAAHNAFNASAAAH
jgi:hypothetical protein